MVGGMVSQVIAQQQPVRGWGCGQTLKRTSICRSSPPNLEPDEGKIYFHQKVKMFHHISSLRNVTTDLKNPSYLENNILLEGGKGVLKKNEFSPILPIVSVNTQYCCL